MTAWQAFQLGVVLSNGIGRNLSVNALYAGPYSTLISNVNFGSAKLPYAPSGAAPKASSFMTFWNVRVSPLAAATARGFLPAK